MAYIKEDKEEKLAEQFIEDAEDEEIGFLATYLNLLRKVTLSNIIKGFFSGVGGFIGAMFCYYHILPQLGLQDYSKFLLTLHS